MSEHRALAEALAQLWSRDGIVVDEPVALASNITALFAAGGGDARAASELLGRSGVRSQWNHILRHDRAAALAARVRPLVTEPLLDVLCGDGSVSAALSDLGVAKILATERSGEYAESILPPRVSFQEFDVNFDPSRLDASTALLSAVLHHEPDPAQLLDAIAQTTTRRWIVIENCVTPEFSRAFHQLADRFFNTCLNDFGVYCGDQHRTLAEWTDLLALYGTVSIADEMFSVPGIPFPYSIFIVSR